MKLLLGDCLYKLKELEDNSVDSIVTDPPYGLSAAPNSGKTSKGGFMGKQWDYDVPSQEIWEECIRVLKPGGHLLAFAGSRTYHRMAVRIEDAGFEIRDQIMWVYGSGFPKSMNIGKGVDAYIKIGKSNPKALREIRMGDDYKPIGQKDYKKGRMFSSEIENDNTTQTIENEYKGWGTALKPAHEPIVMARKPLSEKTVVNNVLEWGTGGINIDESRIGNEERTYKGMSSKKPEGAGTFRDDNWIPKDIENTVEGRFPANIIFDEEAGKLLDEQSGISRSGVVKNDKGAYDGTSNTGFLRGVSNKSNQHGDIGGASRFFYCPKTSKKDRNEGLDDFEDKQRPGQTSKGNYSSSPVCKDCGKTVNGTNNHSNCKEGLEYKPSTTTTKNHHPTVKPTDLMLYLIRLVTPKGGTTLDPFMGSGSTGKGAVRGGFDFIGIEMEEEYFQIAEARIQYEIDNPYNEETGERIEINKNANKFF